MIPGSTMPSLALAQVMPADPNENMALITWLRASGYGKKVRIELNQQLGKTGTPTMGGIMFTISAVLITLIFNTAGRLSMLLPVAVLVAAGFLGAVDDKMNLVGGNRTGMTARFKFVWLALVGVIAGLILHLPDPYGLGLHHVYVPFVGRIDMGFLYFPVAAFAIVAMANAVNFTDGMDTLAAITSAVAFCAYGIIAYRQGQLGVVTFCFIMVGALAGFLWFNAQPAQVFMGDTGSLAIGASLATAAFMTGQWLLLPVVGIVFVAETLSVMIQVTYFKRTGGKRLFKMAPLHHHFELMGWSDNQVTMRFVLAGMMAGLLGVALALL
jgi:phospho-N-acetylmuramoyl-pentapeptide-transferase